MYQDVLCSMRIFFLMPQKKNKVMKIIFQKNLLIILALLKKKFHLARICNKTKLTSSLNQKKINEFGRNL